ncbi:MAG TPA: hypothetical protein DD490_22575, partial [Acidobacteria bacterium]|nr:hypothetical protein [Acidobacteriota bacterium]
MKRRVPLPLGRLPGTALAEGSCVQTATPRKSVLIVDDEPLFLSSVREGLSRRRRDLDILGATQGQEALDLLRSRPIDLVVTDLQMPVLDGFGLIRHMLNERLETPVIVMTAFGTPEMEDSVRGLGAVAYVEKPIDLKALDTTIDRELRRTAKGHIQGITLFGFLQLLQLERKTCTLRVTAGGESGQLCFQDGEIVHAEVGSTTGPDAVYLLEGWAAPEIDIEHVCRARQRTVFASITELLLEGARRADEEKRGPGTPDDDELPMDAAGAWDTQDLQPVLDRIKGLAPAPWNGKPAASWWQEAHAQFGDDGLPGCAVAVRLSDGAAIVLRGTDELRDM